VNRDQPFSIPLTVRGYELDAFQHVNNAVYLQYFEHARWMALRELGPEWLQGKGLTLVVRKIVVEYERPARVFDELVVRLWVDRVGTTSITFGQDLRMRKDDALVATAEVIAVCLGVDKTPHAIPKKWQTLVGWSGEGE
jgi:YbgC/YbaW family acyl-CoA thioester hydrolase